MHVTPLAKWRTETGVSLGTLAEKADVDRQTIRNVELGRTPNLSLRIARRLAKATGETLDYLFPPE